MKIQLSFSRPCFFFKKKTTRVGFSSTFSSIPIRLTHICLVDPSILINWMSPFPILGLSGVCFHFDSTFDRNFFKRPVKILIRRRVLRCLIRVCTVCLCPKNRKLGLYGLNMTPLEQYWVRSATTYQVVNKDHINENGNRPLFTGDHYSEVQFE